MVLDNHVKRKRRLITPMIAAMGDNFSPFSWALEIVPELFWISLLIENLGPVRGVEVARQFGSAAASVSKKDPKPLFAMVTSFSELTKEEQQELLATLDDAVLQDFRSALACIPAIWQDSPFAFIGLASEDDTKSALEKVSPTLEAMYDRRSRPSTLAISTAIYLGFDQEKVFVAPKVFENNATAFSDIEHYPETEASRKAASFFRAMAPMLLLQKKELNADVADWADKYWGELSSLGDCFGDHQEIPALPDVTEGLSGFISAYTHFAHVDFRARESAFQLDLGNPQVRQVLLALLARQATLAIEVVSNPGTWNPNTAPIMLRAMADVHITLVWLLQNPEQRVPMYVDDGLGTIKLEIAHQKKQLENASDEEVEEQKHYLEYLENWLDAQQLEFLTEVNLGSWSGKTTRKMAEEADCVDFYNYVFQPFSSAVHSYWSHTGRINVEHCQNPSHNYHLLPVILSFEPDTHWCRMAAKYLAKSLASFDDFLDTDQLLTKSYGVLHDALSQTDAENEA